MNQSFRLSRLTHPRATFIAIILLAVVFGLFGAVASAMHPEPSTVEPDAAADLLTSTAHQLSGWLEVCR